MPTKTQLISSSPFTDAEGNPLANGYLEFNLNQDATVPGVVLIAGGRTITIALDANGNVSSSPAQYLWGTDVMSPSNCYYRVTGFTSSGQPVWGPNNQQIISGSTFDLASWIPNAVFSWTPSTGSIASAGVLKAVRVPLSSSEILNLGTTPVTIIPGVAGHSYMPCRATLAYTPGTKGYVDPTGSPQLTLTSVANAVTQSFSLTGTSVATGSSFSGGMGYDGTITGGGSNAYLSYYVTISGFVNSGNNGTFVISNSTATFFNAINWNAVPETNPATATIGTTVYTGTITGGGSNGWKGKYFVINGFTNAANNGIFVCTASTTTTLTLANLAGVSESTSALATESGFGQGFGLLVHPQAQGFGLSSNPLPFYGINPIYGPTTAADVTTMCGTLIPQLMTMNVANDAIISAPGFPLILIMSNGPSPTPANLTQGDGTFVFSLVYLDIS